MPSKSVKPDLASHKTLRCPNEVPKSLNNKRSCK